MIAISLVGVTALVAGAVQLRAGDDAKPVTTQRPTGSEPRASGNVVRAAQDFESALRDALAPAIPFAGGIAVLAREHAAGAIAPPALAIRARSYRDQLDAVAANLDELRPPRQGHRTLVLAKLSVRVYRASATALEQAATSPADAPLMHLPLRLKLLGDRVFDRGRVALDLEVSGVARGADERVILPPAIPDFAAEGIAAPGMAGPPPPEPTVRVADWNARLQGIATSVLPVLAHPLTAEGSGTELVEAAHRLAARFPGPLETEAARTVRLALHLAAEAGHARSLWPLAVPDPAALPVRLLALAAELWDAAGERAGALRIPAVVDAAVTVAEAPD